MLKINGAIINTPPLKKEHPRSKTITIFDIRFISNENLIIFDENKPLMDDQSLINGLRDHDKAAVNYIINKFFPMIENLVRTNGKGSLQEAEDLFMKALEVFYLKVQDEDFQLKSSFSTLLYEICKRQWLKTLKYKKRFTRVTFDYNRELIEESFVPVIERSEKYQLYREKFRELSEGCQKVLQMILAGHSMREIANTLGFASEQYTRKRKFQCKKKLIELVRADPRYKELKDHD